MAKVKLQRYSGERLLVRWRPPVLARGFLATSAKLLDDDDRLSSFEVVVGRWWMATLELLAGDVAGDVIGPIADALIEAGAAEVEWDVVKIEQSGRVSGRRVKKRR